MTNSAPLAPDWNYIFGPKDESAAGQQLDFLRNVADRKAGGCFSVNDYASGNAKEYLDRFENAADPLIKSNFVLNKTAASFALYGAAGNGVSYAAVQDISTFLNSIPNTALSSLTPYVEVEFEFEYRANEVGPGKSRHPSLMRFLMGPLRNDTGNADALLDDSRILSVNNNKGNYQLAYSGMEMFTSPMTLVNPNIPNRYVPVLNPYAPLASLTALSVKVQSMKSGKVGFTSASMEVTLHDKTRLLEISELVQPQYFGGVVAWITYGWRCPTAQFKDNPFAKFVNSRMLTKQAFSITNSSFSFDVHSAKIQLTLATTGYREIKNFQLSSIETDIYVASLGNQTQGLNSFYTNAKGNIVGKPTTVKDLNGEMQKVYNELRGTFNEKQASIFGNFMTISGDDNSVIPSTEAIETAQKNIASINGALTNRNDIPADIKQKMQKYVELMKVKYKSDKDGTYAFKDAVDTTASANIFKTFKNIFGNIKIDKDTKAAASDDAPDDNWLPKKWKDFNDLVKKSAIAGTQLHLDSSRQQAVPKKAADDALADLKKAIADDKDVAIVIPENKKKSDSSVLKAAGVDNVKDLWIPTILSGVDYGKSDNTNPNNNKFSRAFVSFGYFFEQLILRCATSDVPGISEAQCFFGEFNNASKAVWAEIENDSQKTRIMNIAEFPISVAVFLQMYRRKVVEKGSETLTLNDIIDLLSSQIEDPRGEAYGFKYLYTPWSTEKKDSNPFVNDQAKSKGEALQADWKMPQIGYHMEVLSPSSLQASDVDLLDLFEVSAKQSRATDGNTKRIMRIKIFDKNYQKPAKQMLSTPQRTLRTVTSSEAIRIAAAFGDDLAPDAIKSLNAKYYNEYAEYVRSLSPKGTTLTQSVTDPGKWYLAFQSNKAVKDFFSQKIPSIVVGSEGSSVISCTVSSNQNAQITASQIKKSLQGVRPGQPLGASGPSGLPVNIMPVTLSMTTIGCPLFEYGQAFFVDFNTGTSVDNTYTIVDIEHKFSPGKFETSLRFAYVNAYDGYRNPRTLENSLDLLASVL